MRFRIDRGVGYDALVAIFLVPHTTIHQEDRTVDRNRPAIGRPRLAQRHQVTPQTADLGRQRRRHGFQAAFPGAPRRVAPLFRQ